MAIRVLVVEDSLTVRRRIVEVLSADPDFEVVGEAGDGARAVQLCRDLRPQAVTMDMMLPGMNGLEATEQIMAFCPTPVLIVSASGNRGEVFRTYDALAAGAVDVLEKPTGEEEDGSWERLLLSTLRIVSRVRVITHLRARIAPKSRTPAPLPTPEAEPAARRPDACRLVAIGTSTGGPGAVQEILRRLPASFPLPILLVVRISAVFSKALVEWLDGQSPLRVGWARDGDALPQPGHGRVVLAPPDRHLVVRGGRLRLDDGPELHSCKPSVDALFHSLAGEVGPACAAFLLTGMGRDGADGLRAIRQAGGRTFAQDEASSVVFGMPREAILLGVAERVLPLDRMSAALAALAEPWGPP